MFNILKKENREATTLKHSENVFHEALKGKENYYHVITDCNQDYDIAYIKNNDMVPENYRNAKKGVDVYPSYLKYDENAINMIELSLLKDHSYIFFNTLNEYSIVIARLALKHTTTEIYFLNPLAKIFLGENSRLHIVNEFPVKNRFK